jgi:hypothetical protein
MIPDDMWEMLLVRGGRLNAWEDGENTTPDRRTKQLQPAIEVSRRRSDISLIREPNMNGFGRQ